MKRMLAVLVGAMTFCASADVYKDVLGWYCGAKDLNGDGTFDPGEVCDARRAGVPDAPSHDVESSVSGTELKSVSYVTADVACAVAGTTLKDQQCLDFTPSNYTWSMPLRSQITNAEYTAIIRYRVNETQLDKDGNPTLGSQSYFLNMGYTKNSGLMFGLRNDNAGFKGYRGTATEGSAINTTLYCTNSTYQTRGACWDELALVASPSAKTAGKTTVKLYLYQPGLPVKTWSADYDTQYTKPGTDASIIFGSERKTQASGAHLYFQGKVHMLAYWNRPLSQTEIEEAFGTVPVSDARRPAVWRIGNDEYGHELFGGSGSTDYALDAYSQTDACFPTKLVAGDSVTISFAALTRDSGMKQIVRLAAAAHSGAGKVTVSMDGGSIGSVDVVPGAGRGVLLPAPLTAGNHTVSLEVAEAASEGIRLDCVELSGSWRLGENDGVNEFAGNGGEDDFYVTNPDLSKMRGNLAFYTRTAADEEKNPAQVAGSIYSDKRVYRIHFNVPADIAGRYKFEYRSDTRTSNGRPSIPLILNVNGKKIWEGNWPGNNNDMIFKIAPDDLVPGDNILEWTTSWEGNDPSKWEGYQDGQHWLGWDYHQFSILGERRGLVLFFR